MVETTEKVCCTKESTMERKLKILALHGYRQNGEAFRQKTGALRKMVHKWANFTYITAPHKVVKVENIDDEEETNSEPATDTTSLEEQYGWFFNRDNKTFKGVRKGGPSIGFEESLRFIEEVFEKEGPFDGLFGFSQGGCMVGLLCDLQEREMLKFKFNFAIIASGFKSDSLPHKKYYERTISMPSLHIYGSEDNIIPKDMSESLAKIFDNPESVEFEGGHYVPGNSKQKSAYQKFFKTLFNAICT